MPKNDSVGERHKIFERFREIWIADKISLAVALLGALAGVVDIGTNIEGLVEKIIQILRSILGEAKAAEGITTGASTSAAGSGELLNTLFTLGCFIAFFWAFIVSIHNNSAAKRQAQKGMQICLQGY